MLFLRFEEISYAVGYLATLTFPLLYLKSWQEHGTYNTKRKLFPQYFSEDVSSNELTVHCTVYNACNVYKVDLKTIIL